MEIPKITALRHWNSCEIRSICIKNRWYTRGDCESYSRMLAFVDKNIPTTENLYRVAYDICTHSNFSGNDLYGDNGDDVATVMEQIEKNVIDKFYYIGEEE